MDMGRTQKIVLLIVGFFLSACTRPEGELSTVSLSIPMATSIQKNKVSQSVTAQTLSLTYIAINITTPSGDMPPIFCAWDLEEKTTQGPCQFSTSSVGVSVPIGSARLFQVIMAYSDGAGGSMTFKYGDSQQDLAGASSTVSIALTDVGGALQSGGHIRARYFGSSTNGPTGLLKVMMKPNPFRPPMPIQQTEIFGGWFHAFSLENTPMDYVVNGVSLFGGPINKSGLINLMNNSGGTFKVNPTATATDYEVWGFFGDTAGVSGKTAAPSA